MTQLILTNPQIVINSVDLSNRIDQVTLEETYTPIETTTFGQGHRTFLAGLGEHKFTVEFTQDYASGSVSATIDPLMGLTTTVSIKPVNGTTTTTNPAYTFTVLVAGWKPMDAKVGELSKSSATWPVVGAVTKATS